MNVKTMTTQMQHGPAPRSHLAMHSVASPRLLDQDPAAAEAAAKAAADKSAAEEAAATAAAKTAAEAAEKAALEERLKGMSDSEAKLLKEQMATKAKLKEAQEAAAAAEAKLKAYEGLDPSKARELLEAAQKAETERKKLEEENLRKAGDWERLKAMMADEHKKETEALATKVTETAGALDQAQKTIENLTIGSAFSQSNWISTQTVLTGAIARQVFGSHFDSVNGEVVGFDKPRGEAGRTQLVNASGSALPFEDAIKKIVDGRSDKDSILRSNLKDGTGSRTTEIRPGLRTAPAEQRQGPYGMSRIKASLEKGALAKKA